MLFGKTINKFYFKYSLFFIIGIISLVVVDYIQLDIPEIIGNVIDGLKEKTLTIESLKSFCIRLFIVGFILFIGRFTWRICIFGNGVRCETDLRNILFGKMQKLSQRFFSENKTGALMAYYTNDLSAIRRSFGDSMMMLIDALCLGGFAFYKMFMINKLASLISFVALVIVMVISYIFGKKIKKASEENYEAYSALCDYVQEDFTGIHVIKSFVKENVQHKNFEKYNKNDNQTCMNIVKNSVKMDTFILVTLSLINLFIILYGAIDIYKGNGTFTVGRLTTFLSYFDSLIWPIECVGRLVDLSSKGKASLNRVDKILNEVEDVNDNNVTLDYSDYEFKGGITFNNLSFGYLNNVVEDINLEIKPGEFIGLMGSTGCGKTTLVDLLLRIYNVKEDSLFIDGIDIMKLPIKKVRDLVSYVPQDNFLYSKSIMDNICFSDSKNNEARAIEMAKFSDVDKDIQEFKDKYNTILGERGVTVSGGQKQRISIARALYKNSLILVLDNSLSAVDTETEKSIITSLKEMRKGLTTIVIAHRVSTLEYMDKVIVLEDGKVTGFDSPDNLLKKNKYYKNEVRLQELDKEIGD